MRLMDTLIRPRDVIAVYIGDAFSFYARVEEILPDVKKGWRRLRFLVLSQPLKEVIWTLEPSQIDGEPFTMGGTPIRIERVPDAEPTPMPEDDFIPNSHKPKAMPKVIAFPGKTKK